MRFRIIFLIPIYFLLFSCSIMDNQFSPTQLIIQEPTLPSKRTKSKEPPLSTYTSSNTTTIFPIFPTNTPSNTQKVNNLSSSGPWILFTNEFDELVLTDIENHPTILLKYQLATGFNPISTSNNEGMVGIIILDKEGGGITSIDKSLVLLTIPTMAEIVRIPLVAFPGIPKDEIHIREIKNSIENTPQWSPNGRYLAFIAAIDGPSADLYLYDNILKRILRLTDGINQVGNFWWSPDGKWIVHEEISEFYSWKVEAIWAVRYDGREIKKLFIPKLRFAQTILGWYSSHSFVIYDDDIGFGMCQIRYVDILSSEARILFPGCSYNMAWDHKSGTIAFIPYMIDESGEDEEFAKLQMDGDEVYLISIKNTCKIMVYKGIMSLGIRWDSVFQLFVINTPCLDNPQGFVAFSKDGIIKCHTAPETFPSPDDSYFLLLDPIIIVYDKVGNEIFALDTIIDKYMQIEWLPDSSGLLINANGKLFYVSIRNQIPKELVNTFNISLDSIVLVYNNS